MADIKTKLEISGEQKYKQAIKEANTALHTLGTELSLASAQFKADGDAMKLMESRSKTLKAELEQQSKVVENTARALEEATKKYGENSKQAEQWQAKLNNAKSKLLNLEHELDNNNNGLDRNGRAFDKAGQKAQGFGGELKQVDTISKGVTFQALNTALTNIGGVFERVGQTAAKAWKLVWNTASESSNWADDIATLSLQTGISVNELQKWAYAADYVDTDISSIVKAMTKLINPSKEVLDIMKQLGIHRKDAWLIDEGDAVDSYETVKSEVDLFWEVIDAMGAMADTMEETEYAATMDSMAQSLFGKSYREILPLLQAGREVWEQYGQQAEDTGVVLEDELVANLGAFNDSLQTLENNYQAFQNIFSAELAPGLKDAADAMSGLLSELNLWMQTDAGKEALGSLSDAVSTLVTTLAENIDFTSIAEGAAGAIDALTGALQWFADNGETVKGIIAGIGLALAGIKISKGVLSFAALMRLGFGSGGLFKGGGGGSAAASTPAAPAADTGGGAGGAGLLTLGKSWGAKLVSGVKGVMASGGSVALGSAAIVAAVLEPIRQYQNYEKEQEQKELDAIQANAEILAQARGKTGQAALAIVRTATEGLGTAPRLDIMGDSILADALQVHAANNAIAQAGLTGLTNRTELLYRRREQNGSYTPMAENELLRRAMQEAYTYLETGEVEQATMDLSDTLDAILAVTEALDETMSLDNMEALYSLIDDMVADEGIFGRMTDTTKDLLGRYFDEESGFGAGSNSQYTDARAVLDAIYADLEHAWDTEHTNQSLENMGEGMSESLSTGIDASAAVTEEAGSGLSASVALGIAEGTDAVSAAASSLVAAVVSAIASANIPSVPRGYGGVSNNYNSSSSLYIDKYNQYSGADVSDLAAALNRNERYNRMGVGA